MRIFFKFLFLSLLLAVTLSSCAFRDADLGNHEDVTPYESVAALAPVESDVKHTESDPTTEADSKTYPITMDSIPLPDTLPAESETEPLPAESESTAASQPETQPNVLYDPTKEYRPKAMMYHLIRDEVYGIYDNLFVKPTEFEKQLTLLDSMGYEYLFAEEWQIKNNPTVIITLDDGYLDNYTDMFPILKAHGAKATVFLVTNLIDTDGYMTREMIKEMSDSGLVSFQCHTVNHNSLSSLSEDGVRYEITESSRIIEEITGKPVRAIAYPAGQFNDTVISVAGETLNFAYTTKSPYSVTEYTDFTVPRYYIGRYMTESQFKNILY